jgi:hypothetical protein
MGLFSKAAKLRPEEPASQDRATYQATMADELASTVEHVLSTRYALARVTEQTAAKLQAVAQVVTSESLLAELAAARPSRPSELPAAEPEAPRKKSPLLGLFAFVGCAMILYGLLLKSPWHDQVPSIDRITQLLK